MPKKQQSNDQTLQWLGIGLALLFLGAVLIKGMSGGGGVSGYSPFSPSPEPTERELNEAGTRALLKSRHPNVSDAELDRGTKRIVDEWDKAK